MPVVQAWAETTVRRNGQTMYDGITQAIEIDAPAEEVWAVVSDVRGLPAVLSGMTRLEVDGEDASLRVGLTWTQTRVIRGHSGSETLCVAEVDSGSRYVTEGRSHGFEYVTTWSVLSLGVDKSRLSCTFRGLPRTWFARVMFKMFSGSGDDASRDAMRTDLSDIAAAVGSAR